MSAQVQASLLSNAGQASITVQSPAPGGGASNALQFEMDSAGVTPPSFGSTSATISAGATASYAVTLPVGATNVSVTCLNLPSGATCSYTAASQQVSIVTQSTTPAGSYSITVVFTETLSGAAASLLLPVLILPFWPRGRFGKPIHKRYLLCMLMLLGIAVFGMGCGGGGGSSSTTNNSVRSSGVVTLAVE